MKNSPLFHGLVLVKKPAGVTSHDVVARARRVFQTPSVGHCGTLDPMATGLLILLVGEATKVSQYILEGDKSYRVGVKLGQETDTLDTTGEIISQSEVRVSKEDLFVAAGKLSGTFQWVIPKYSAKKVDGKKLYEYAREGKAVEIPTKEMKFWDVKYLGSSPDASQEIFEMTCSKGSFIRSWVSQLGKDLGCGATMASLERTASSPFRLSEAITLEEVGAALAETALPQALIPLESALPASKRVKVRGLDAHLFKNGQIGHELRARLIQIFDPKSDQFVFIVSGESQKPMGLVSVEPGKGFTVRRVFNIL